VEVGREEAGALVRVMFHGRLRHFANCRCDGAERVLWMQISQVRYCGASLNVYHGRSTGMNVEACLHAGMACGSYTVCGVTAV
jgi:hypothetical protein